MADLTWLSEQARQIHQIFESMFYLFVTTLFLIGILIEYFKWPIGGIPTFSTLVGRVLIAAILLHTYPDISNALADFVDALSKKLGDLNNFNLVLAKMGERFDEFTIKNIGLSIKEGLVWIVSFVAYAMLYITVHAVNAFLLLSWTILYVCSPFLIALFVLPSTSIATKTLFRSLIEVSCWKIVWSILATLLWSYAVSDISKPGHDVSFITVIFLNLLLAGSLLLTPLVVHALTGAGMSSLGSAAGGLIAGATMGAPFSFIQTGTKISKRGYKFSGAQFAKNKMFPKEQRKKRKPSNRHSNLKPPEWHKEVPWPTEP